MEGVIQIKRLQLLYSTLINQWLLLLIENLVYGNSFFSLLKKKAITNNKNKNDTTVNGGSLGSCIDEERSKVR